ncbi:MAG: hypothetical protein Q8L88_02440 [Bacteroidota bacterium]|nr:hypothetical protein [Bacteroidota bacterium]
MNKNSQLTLIDPLCVSPLPGGEVTPKPKSWQQTFAGIFWFKYKETTGEECKLGFGALKKMLNQHAVKFWVDEETGQPEVPSVEQWTEEITTFFEDEFAAAKRGFHFSYLLSQYGSFKKFKPAKRELSNPVITYECKNCHRIMGNPRSKWERYKNQTAICTQCKARFSVNDVLNQIPTIQNIIPMITGEKNHDTNTNK